MTDEMATQNVEATGEDPAARMARVASVSAAVRDGSYVIDQERLATALLVSDALDPPAPRV